MLGSIEHATPVHYPSRQALCVTSALIWQRCRQKGLPTAQRMTDYDLTMQLADTRRFWIPKILPGLLINLDMDHFDSQRKDHSFDWGVRCRVCASASLMLGACIRDINLSFLSTPVLAQGCLISRCEWSRQLLIYHHMQSSVGTSWFRERSRKYSTQEIFCYSYSTVFFYHLQDDFVDTDPI